MIIHDSWWEVFQKELNQLYFAKLSRFIRKERKAGKQIFPKDSDVFKAFNLCPPERVKIVIVGQDPYHTPGMADGLSFGVPLGVKKPRSLQNIFKELTSDLGVKEPNHGRLYKVAKRGVLFLNSILTVEAGRPLSHAGLGWERFTDYVISYLVKRSKTPIVFMLWGIEAQKKLPLINRSRHLVLTSTHPSPFSATVKAGNLVPFLGSKPFSMANKFLESKGLKPVDWTIEDEIGLENDDEV